MQHLGAALLLVVIILLLPVILPLVAVRNALHRRRLVAAARQFACIGCGAVLGREAVHRADAEWDRRMQELRDQHPDVRFRIVRDLNAICPTCGRRYRFREATRTFVEVAG